MEVDNSFEEIKRILADIARITKQNAKLIGDIGNKFGSFTEEMAFPSMDKVIRKQFGMETVSTRVRTKGR